MLMPKVLLSKQSQEKNDHIIFRHNLEPYDKLPSIPMGFTVEKNYGSNKHVLKN